MLGPWAGMAADGPVAAAVADPVSVPTAVWSPAATSSGTEPEVPPVLATTVRVVRGRDRAYATAPPSTRVASTLTVMKTMAIRSRTETMATPTFRHPQPETHLRSPTDAHRFTSPQSPLSPASRDLSGFEGRVVVLGSLGPNLAQPVGGVRPLVLMARSRPLPEPLEGAGVRRRQRPGLALVAEVVGVEAVGFAPVLLGAGPVARCPEMGAELEVGLPFGHRSIPRARPLHDLVGR